MDDQDETRTLCGKKLTDCPGHYVPEREYDCRACAATKEIRERRRERTERMQAEKEQAAESLRRLQQQREAEQREWWRKYDAYLQSPEWRQRRAAVLRRANGICEGCGKKRAVEVHHTTYRHVFNEPLFELVAICVRCHERITAMDRGESA